ncbi:MAG: membrane protein insertase YidC [Gammaproteobacteria bacterium]|jgi:YidC/Oxa1 family membrane protein insertase|nr:membrane protein insertase YidC [Gammaproteobacteria bacterium]MDA8868204.1 membrane protein insertase YidC [Pseudomonadales bacterium]MBT5682478.1 membrane protein insertase YidC [Gammaproteobacteria bacterium]MBT6024473.1 membrane protein insertase YidC [Gammaproteobacteria bacterium]MBT6558682.1 membrane protein insertase YidC [Gammaproteobacteria bacterium]|tara:strand:+ start:810 stop:2549 length:1740 start_codon:yes stop_codon:yes gene_type:complete
MLPPEIQRIVLLIGLAATSYLLILAWNEDMQADRSPISYSDAPLVADQQTNAIDTSAIRPSVVDQSQSDSDIPDVSLLSNDELPTSLSTTDAFSEAQAQTPESRLVVVTTPKLKVWIDLLGGDIVRVQLPQYPVALDLQDTPYLLLEQNQNQTYVAQSGLIGPNGLDKNGQRPQYSSSVRELTIDENDGQSDLVLSTVADGMTVEKVFSFTADKYLLDVSYRLTNTSNVAFTAGMFTQIKRDRKAVLTDDSFSLAPDPYLGGAITTIETPYQKVEFDDLDEDALQAENTGGWVAFLQHYFLSAWVAPADQQIRYYARPTKDNNYLFGFTGPAKVVQPGASGVWSAEFYAGPKDQVELEEISEHLNLTVDYGFLWWIAIPLFKALTFFHDLVGNWGVAIILLTLAVKIALGWVSARGYRSMANMRRVAPAMKKLQERYSNDREKLSKEMMALYKKEGANPLGGCLPMLAPMPIFLALYWVLLESVELRQAPFMFWIEDLSAMDPYFILPLLMGASTYLMQSLNPQVGDPMQVKMMKLMPIMFTVLFLFFPAGLVLYWLVNNLLSIAQQTYIYKKVENERA